MTDDHVRDLIGECQGMSHEEILAAYHVDYYDDAKPYVRQAFEQMNIDEHEVSAWVQRNIK
jgi:hypothetical protein